MRWMAVGLLAASLGCGGKSKETCRKEAAELAALFEGANLEPNLIPLDKDMHLVERSDLTSQLQQAPVVSVGPARLAFQGSLLGGPDELFERLQAAYRENAAYMEMRRRQDAPDARRVLLVIDAESPWRKVVDAVHAANRAGMTSPVFVFAVPATKSPPRTPIDDEIDKIIASDSGAKATQAAAITKRVTESCPAVIRVFGEVAMERDKARYIATEVPKALVECNCSVDMPSVRSVLWRVLANPNPVRVLELDPDAPAEKISLAGGMLWKQASKRLTPSTKNAELVAE